MESLEHESALKADVVAELTASLERSLSAPASGKGSIAKSFTDDVGKFPPVAPPPIEIGYPLH